MLNSDPAIETHVRGRMSMRDGVMPTRVPQIDDTFIEPLDVDGAIQELQISLDEAESFVDQRLREAVEAKFKGYKFADLTRSGANLAKVQQLRHELLADYRSQLHQRLALLRRLRDAQ